MNTNSDSSAPLKLQPVLLNDDSSKSNTANGQKLTLQPHLHDRPLTTDDLWSMWNVATKAKSSINQGQRLENLSWRLWYSTSQKRQHEITQSDNGRQQLDPLLAKTCSSILSEIQRAAHKGDPFSRSFASDDSDGATMTTSAAGTTTLFMSPEAPSSPPASPSRPITMDDSMLHTTCAVINQPKSTNEYLARKKKKNVERYMRKYQRRLEGILEEHDQKDVEEEVNLEPVGSSMSTTDSATNQQQPQDQDDLFVTEISSPKSSFSDKQPSMLSQLLSRVRPNDYSPRPIAPIPRPCTSICLCDSSSFDDHDDFSDCFEDTYSLQN